MSENIQQQNFYFAKYDSSRDYSRPADTSSAPIGLINKADGAVQSVFEASVNNLRAVNTQKVNEQNLASGFNDVSRTISSIYYQIAEKFNGIKYEVTSQKDADRADKEFEAIAKSIEQTAQQKIDEKISEIATKLAEEDAINSKSVTGETLELRNKIQSRGFSQHSIAHVQTDENTEISFVILGDKYLVAGEEVDEATFLKSYDEAIAKYNEAKANGKARKFCEPYLEKFDKLSITDNHDGTFTEETWLGQKFVYNYDGSVKEVYSEDSSRRYDRKNKITEIDADKLSSDDKLKELYFDPKKEFPFSDETLGDAEIKDNVGNTVFVKKNGKFYDNQGHEVDFSLIKQYLEENKGEKIVIHGVPSVFGI